MTALEEHNFVRSQIRFLMRTSAAAIVHKIGVNRFAKAAQISQAPSKKTYQLHNHYGASHTTFWAGRSLAETLAVPVTFDSSCSQTPGTAGAP